METSKKLHLRRFPPNPPPPRLRLLRWGGGGCLTTIQAPPLVIQKGQLEAISRSFGHHSLGPRATPKCPPV